MELATAKRLHKELWDWVARENKNKYDHPKLNYWHKKYDLINGCFPCTICGGNCDKCPIDEPEHGYCKIPYPEWNTKWEGSREIALRIKNWRWKE